MDFSESSDLRFLDFTPIGPEVAQQSQSIRTQIHMSQHVQILDKANHNKP